MITHSKEVIFNLKASKCRIHQPPETKLGTLKSNNQIRLGLIRGFYKSNY